ncbi:hypothetical protein AGMMS4956_21650 [Bacteroidia bacterium]|nr:hypothetical protein AGMMS4956_21650 [Bacteroidia bacterium]
MGYAVPFADGYDAGLLFYLEPKYEVVPQIAVGLRWEGALFAGATEGVSVSMSSGYYATGDYYFTNSRFRPFAGVGLGAYSTGSASVTINDQTIKGDKETTFGALIRAGFDVSHFRLSASYNLATTKEMFHFVSISLGFYIGGGKK